MYFPFSELRKWSKKTAETRRRDCAVLPLILIRKASPNGAAGFAPPMAESTKTALQIVHILAVGSGIFPCNIEKKEVYCHRSV